MWPANAIAVSGMSGFNHVSAISRMQQSLMIVSTAIVSFHPSSLFTRGEDQMQEDQTCHLTQKKQGCVPEEHAEEHAILLLFRRVLSFRVHTYVPNVAVPIPVCIRVCLYTDGINPAEEFNWNLNSACSVAVLWSIAELSVYNLQKLWPFLKTWPSFVQMTFHCRRRSTRWVCFVLNVMPEVTRDMLFFYLRKGCETLSSSFAECFFFPFHIYLYVFKIFSHVCAGSWFWCLLFYFFHILTSSYYGI